MGTARQARWSGRGHAGAPYGTATRSLLERWEAKEAPMPEHDLVKFQMTIDDSTPVHFAVTGSALRSWAHRHRQEFRRDLGELFSAAEDEIYEVAERLYAA